VVWPRDARGRRAPSCREVNRPGAQVVVRQELKVRQVPATIKLPHGRERPFTQRPAQCRPLPFSGCFTPGSYKRLLGLRPCSPPSDRGALHFGQRYESACRGRSHLPRTRWAPRPSAAPPAAGRDRQARAGRAARYGRRWSSVLPCLGPTWPACPADTSRLRPPVLNPRPARGSPPHFLQPSRPLGPFRGGRRSQPHFLQPRTIDIV
jgi:hypothetical protein